MSGNKGKPPRKVRLGPLDPEKVLTAAIGFQLGAEGVHRFMVAGTNTVPLWSQFTLQAFAVELFFKALIAIEGKLVPQTHEFVRLMEALSPKSQERLGSLFMYQLAVNPLIKQAQGSGKEPVPKTLQDLLAMMNNSFDLFRYIFETGKTPPPHTFCGVLMWCLRSAIATLDHTLLRKCDGKRSAEFNGAEVEFRQVGQVSPPPGDQEAPDHAQVEVKSQKDNG